VCLRSGAAAGCQGAALSGKALHPPRAAAAAAALATPPTPPAPRPPRRPPPHTPTPQHAGFRVVVPQPDLSEYDMSKHGADNPVAPFFETSCMDAAPPHVGDRPCCSKGRRER
jgi:hypothetical protein